MESETDLSAVLLGQATSGDDHALGQLFDLYRNRLKAMIRLRMSDKLKQRLDDSDVLQESLREVARRLSEYLDDPSVPFYLWLRQIVIHKLIDVHRRHLGAEMRNADRELHIFQLRSSSNAESLAFELVGKLTSPSRAALRAEICTQVQEALQLMEPMDREVLALRHFEQLSNSDVAVVLEIEPSAASKRYTRAIQRLKKILDAAA